MGSAEPIPVSLSASFPARRSRIGQLHRTLFTPSWTDAAIGIPAGPDGPLKMELR